MTIYVSDKLQATAATVSGDPTPTTSWQWLRNSSAISGATSSDYVVSADDVGASISVIQSAINMLGTAIANSASDGPVQAFTPSLLFRGSTAGTWYEPADMTTLFRDAAGTLPVTAVEQPVGLMLDKSKGLVLGPELVTNGDFSNGTTGWTLGSGWSVSGGKLIATSVAFAVEAKQAIATLVAGSRYVVSFDVVVTSGTLKVNLSDLGISTTELLISASGTYTYRPLQSGTAQITFWASSTFTGSIDNISVRELPGNHAFNSSGNSANFPVLSARYNLLTKTEDFSDAVWTKTRCSINANAITAPDGTLSADKVVADTTSGNHAILQIPATVVGTTYTQSFFAKAGEYRYIYISPNGPWAFQMFDLQTGTVGPLLANFLSATMVSVGNGWYRCSATWTATSTTNGNYIWIGNNTADSVSYTGDGTSGIYLWGADLRVANDALNQPAYQCVNTATDYDTVGFKPYLRFNGTNQWLQTNSIDFSYGDKMFVSAGVRKLSDAATATFIESSAAADTNAGAFYFRVPVSGFAAYDFVSRGTAIAEAKTAIANYPAPITNVVSGVSNISAPSAALRINGSQVDLSTATQGTGNFGNYPLYIGARAGSSLWFNGRLYSLIVAGKLANAVEITETEKYVNGKTAAY